MGDFRQITQHGERVGPIGILPGEFFERGSSIPAHNHVKQVEHPAAICQTEHRPDLIGGGFPRAVRDGLIQQRQRIADRALCRPGHERERIFRHLSALKPGDFRQMCDHHLRLNPAQVKTLTARENRHRHFANFGCRKDEFHMGRGLFERFEQRVERARREHMHLVDDVDFIARRGGAVMNGIDNFANVIHARARCGVHFHDVHVAPFHDRGAMLARAAGLGRWPAVAVFADTVHPLGDDPRGGGFARAANARHHKGLVDAVSLKRVLERADHRILPDHIGKGFRAIFSREDLIPLILITLFGHLHAPFSPQASYGGRAAPARMKAAQYPRLARLAFIVVFTIFENLRPRSRASAMVSELCASSARSLRQRSRRSGDRSPASMAARTAQPGSVSCWQSENLHWAASSVISSNSVAIPSAAP